MAHDTRSIASRHTHCYVYLPTMLSSSTVLVSLTFYCPEAETLCSLLVLGSFECNHSLSGCQLVETASVYDDDCELLNCNRNIFNAGNKLAGSLAPVWRNHRAAHLATSSLVTNGNMHEIGQWYYSAATQHMHTLTWLIGWGAFTDCYVD